MLVTRHQDRPGIVGAVGTSLADAGINISSLELSRLSAAGEAMMFVSVDSPLPDAVLAALSAVPGMREARVVELPSLACVRGWTSGSRPSMAAAAVGPSREARLHRRTGAQAHGGALPAGECVLDPAAGWLVIIAFMSRKPFASSADLAEKEATLEELTDGVYAYTAQGDPNVGCIVGTDAILAIEARATPVMAQRWIDVRADAQRSCRSATWC